MALGLCKQSELDTAVQKAAAKKAREGETLTDNERRKLLSTEQSLDADTEPRIPTAIEGLQTFTLGQTPSDERTTARGIRRGQLSSTCRTRTMTTRMTRTNAEPDPGAGLSLRPPGQPWSAHPNVRVSA